MEISELNLMLWYDELTSPSARSGSRLSRACIHHLVACLPGQNGRIIAISNASDSVDAIEKEGNNLLVPVYAYREKQGDGIRIVP